MLWLPCIVLSATSRLAVLKPASVGANFTLILQLAPGSRLVPEQPSESSTKSLALAPVIAALLIPSASLPVFVIVAGVGGPVVPTLWPANWGLDRPIARNGTVELYRSSPKRGGPKISQCCSKLAA